MKTKHDHKNIKKHLPAGRLREDEKRMFMLLKPLLELRAIFSWIIVVMVFFLALFKYYINWPSFACILVFVAAVNYLTFFFIKKEFPVKAFMIMNGTIFTALASIAVYYTGGDRSPFLLTYFLLIILVSFVSSSLFLTLLQTILVIIAADAVILLDVHGILDTKPFFLNLTISVFDDLSPFYTIFLWDVAYAFTGFLFGTLANVQGKIRKELQEANTENIHLQNIVKSLVSRTTWAEASEAAKKQEHKLREHREVRTILFSDIVGFSSISENIKPEELVAMLNLHFQEMGEIIYRHEGDIDKFMGDSIMAVFENPENAMAAAIEMQKKIARNRENEPQSDPISKIKIRIGINTGEVVIGNMGTSERTERSLIGDAVNVAQRLQSMATPGYVLVSQATFKLIKRLGYKFTSVGRVKIKGKKEIIRAYQLNPAKH